MKNLNKEQWKEIDEMVRDFCSVVPKSKSEVRKRISNLLAKREKELIEMLHDALIDITCGGFGDHTERCSFISRGSAFLLPRMFFRNLPLGRTGPYPASILDQDFIGLEVWWKSVLLRKLCRELRV